MALLAVAIAVPLRFSASYLTALRNGITAGVGAITCLLGAYIVYEIGFVEGLLMG
jgi:hypothetical protein